MRVDAHQHFWQLDARRGQWPPPSLAAIHRDFAPADLLPALRAAGVDATVLVQTLPDAADTRFMLDLADRHAFIAGVVGWAELKAADAVGTIAALARHPLLKGVRPMLHELDDPEWIDDAALDPAVGAMVEHALCFDALVRPAHLAALGRFARRHPALPIVIDHGAKPDIAAGGSAGWREGMGALADLPNVHCKLSGLLTEAAPGADAHTVAPYVEALLALFGTGRVMWGSDWPVVQLASTYGAWLAMCEALVPGAAHEAVFGANAARFYRLAPLPRPSISEELS